MNETQRVTEINGCISMAAKRQYGLLKLAEFLERCSSSSSGLESQLVFESNCVFWLQTLYQTFENHPVALHAKLAYYCFYLLVQNSRNASPELTRLLSTQFIEKGVTHLLKSNETLTKSSLMCLNELIANYRASTSQFRAKIESYVMSKLDNQPDDVIEWASVCYAKLPYMHKNHTGNSNSNNNSSVDTWNVYFTNALTQANSILNELFEDVSPQSDLNGSMRSQNDSSMMESSTSSSTIQQTNNSVSSSVLFANRKLVKDIDNLDVYYKRMSSRFRACCLCLRNLFAPLRDETIVKIRPGELIKLLTRIFTIDFKRLMQSARQNQESLYLSHILSHLLNSALDLAERFFKLAGTNLLVHTNAISHSLAHLGQNLYEFKCLESVPSFYQCLTEWIASTGANSNFHKYSTLIVENLLERIKPFTKNSLLLDQSKIKTKFTKLINNNTSSKSSSSLFDEKTCLNSHQQVFARATCVSSLKFLRVFMQHFDSRLTCNQMEQIQETVVDILLCIQYNSNTRQPYDQVETRLALYENLFQLCFSRNAKLAAPLAIAVNLFQSALDDQSAQIRAYAQQSLIYLRALTFPTKSAYQLEYTLTRSTSDETSTNVTNQQHSSLASTIREPGQQETASLGMKLNSLFNNNNNQESQHESSLNNMLDLGVSAAAPPSLELPQVKSESLLNGGGQKRKREEDASELLMNGGATTRSIEHESKKKFQGESAASSDDDEDEEDLDEDDEEEFDEEFSEQEEVILDDDEDEDEDDDDDEEEDEEMEEEEEEREEAVNNNKSEDIKQDDEPFEEDSVDQNDLEDDDDDDEEEDDEDEEDKVVEEEKDTDKKEEQVKNEQPVLDLPVLQETATPADAVSNHQQEIETASHALEELPSVVAESVSEVNQNVEEDKEPVVESSLVHVDDESDQTSLVKNNSSQSHQSLVNGDYGGGGDDDENNESKTSEINTSMNTSETNSSNNSTDKKKSSPKTSSSSPRRSNGVKQSPSQPQPERQKSTRSPLDDDSPVSQKSNKSGVVVIDNNQEKLNTTSSPSSTTVTAPPEN